MQNRTKSFKAIRLAHEATKAAKQARLLQITTGSHAFRFHPVNNPAVHWSGVSQRTLDALRANRAAIIEAGGSYWGQAGVNIQRVSLDSYYNPSCAPEAGAIVEHSQHGLGIVNGITGYSAQCGMTTSVHFEGADRTISTFCDDLVILEGNLKGTTGVPDESIDSKAERVNLDSERVKALRVRYSPEEAEAEEEEDTAFGEFMTNEFENEAF